MDTSRLRTGELIAGIAGVVLFIVMFLPWFGISVEDAQELNTEELTDLAEAFPTAETNGDEFTASAWEAMSFIDIILLIAIVVAVGLAVATALSRTVALPVAASALTAGLGILATVLVLYRLIDPPYALGREFWLWVGLIAAGGIAYGGWRSMQEEGTTFGAQADRLQDRVGGRDEPPPPPPPPPPSGTPPSGTPPSGTAS